VYIYNSKGLYLYVWNGFIQTSEREHPVPSLICRLQVLRLRAGTGAIRNRVANFSGPRCVPFQAAIGIFDEAKAGFKGLEKDPEATREHGNGPCHKKEKDQPKEGKARIAGHCEGCCCWMDGLLC
jgi:hypothetical protein